MCVPLLRKTERSKTLNIPLKNYTDSVIENVRDPTLKPILKYCKYPSSVAVKRKTKSGLIFAFAHFTKEDVIKGIKSLDAWKASQEDDIPSKIIKENSDIFSNFL